MNFLKRHPVFSTVIVVFAAVVLGEIWYLLSLREQVRTADQEVQQRLAEIERLQRQKPSPNDDNVRIAQADFARNVEVLTAMLRDLNVGGADEIEFFRGEPADGTTALLNEIFPFVERMRAEAERAGVRLNPDERFGFSAYTNEPPEPQHIRYVFRQHKTVEYLLQRLFAARPTRLIAVQREQPIALDASGSAPAPGAVARPSVSSGGGNQAARDIFVIDPQVSARTPNYVDTMAFRVIFAGQTSALRGFMNAIDIPLVVRSVEVSPYVADAMRGGIGYTAGGGRPPGISSPGRGATGAAGAGSNVPVPIVAENDSLFTVTIELVEVKIRPPEVPAMVGANP